MSEDQVVTDETTTPENNAGGKVPEGYVSKADLDRALKDMHKYKVEAKEFKDKYKGIEEQKLKDQENWKQYAEVKEKEAKEALEESVRIKSSYVNEKKFSAVKEAAMKQGIIAQALSDLELLDLSSVVMETTNTGKINVLGADTYINNLKTMKPHWFGQLKTNVNTNIPGVSTDTAKVYTAADITKLSLEASKTGDYTTYKKALESFNKQK